MGVFDSLLNETTAKFGISYNQAGSLLSALLGFMNQGGGVSEFLGRFRSGGLSNSVSSWLSGNPQAISADDLENGMGQSTVSAIASKAGVPISAASSALAFILPKVIQKIAPSGVVPSRIPSEMMSYLPESARVGVMVYQSWTAPGMSAQVWPPSALACHRTSIPAAPAAAVPEITELNIGHNIVARAVLVGMERAVREMIAAMRG